jgi:hypothetical protein
MQNKFHQIFNILNYSFFVEFSWFLVRLHFLRLLLTWKQYCSVLSWPAGKCKCLLKSINFNIHLQYCASTTNAFSARTYILSAKFPSSYAYLAMSNICQKSCSASRKLENSAEGSICELHDDCMANVPGEPIQHQPYTHLQFQMVTATSCMKSRSCDAVTTHTNTRITDVEAPLTVTGLGDQTLIESRHIVFGATAIAPVLPWSTVKRQWHRWRSRCEGSRFE